MAATLVVFSSPAISILSTELTTTLLFIALVLSFTFTGIKSEITRSLGVIDFWFMASGKRIHKTVHHFLFTEIGGKLAPQVTEVDDVQWFPIEEIVSKLAYPDERKLIAKSGDLKP